MLLRFPVLPAVFLFGAVLAHGQKYSNEFLSIGVGARAQAMGNSVIANVNDVTAGVWNPAGLAAMDPQYTVELGAMHSEWFAGLGKFDYLAATLPLANPRKRLAFSVIRFGIDDIPNTLTLYKSDGTINFDNLPEFSADDYALLLSYGQPLCFANNGELILGGSVQVVLRRIGPFANSWGFGLDAGLQYRLHGLRVGFLAKDITTTFNAWSFNFSEADKETLNLTGNEVPINSLEITRPQLILGVGYAFQWGKVSFLPELNLVFTTDGRRNTLLSADPISMDPSFGLEVGYNGFVFLRGGLNQFQRESDFDGQEKVTLRPSMGVGLRIGTFFIDYAFTDPGDQRNTFSHVFSLRLAFRKKKS